MHIQPPHCAQTAPHQLLWGQPECFLVRHASWSDQRIWLGGRRTLFGCPQFFITRGWLLFMPDIQVNSVFMINEFSYTVKHVKCFLVLIPHLFALFPVCSREPHAPSSETESYERKSSSSQSDSSIAEKRSVMNEWIYRFGAAVSASPGEPPPPSFLGHLLLHDLLHRGLEQRAKQDPNKHNITQ